MGLASKIAFAFFRPLWRVTRGTTMGAQAIVINEAGEVLLVRHGYRPGWHFPGGGVEWGEALEEALARELYEETMVEITGPTRLHGIFTNFKKFKGDHIGVYIVKEWQQPQLPEPTHEIKEIGFFPPDALPEGTADGTRNRLAEIFSDQPISARWT